MTEINFNPTLTEKQTIAWDCLESRIVDEVLFGGAKYGGKSWFLCVWVYKFACEFAKKYRIPKSAHPLPIGFIGRKIAKHFSDTTLETWFKTIPAAGYVAKGNPVDLIIDDRVLIMTGGLDNRELVKKFNSAEFAFFAVDQAEETTRDDISSLRAATFGRLVVNGKVIPGKGLFTANPADCWLKNEFIKAPAKNRRFVPALPTDNPHCTQRYVDNLKDSFKHRPKLLAAYLYGDWNVLGVINQVIESQWVRRAAEHTLYPATIKKLLVCDPARFGDDETVIYYLENSEIKDDEIMAKSRTTDISNCLARMSKQHDDCEVAVESIGADLGAGVIDELVQMKVKVRQFNPAAKAREPEKYYNKRAEAWDYVAREFDDSNIELKNTEPTLVTQLCTPTYRFRHGKLLIESKEDIKARTGRSPDRADAYVIGVYEQQFTACTEEEAIDEYQRTEIADSYKPESVFR